MTTKKKKVSLLLIILALVSLLTGVLFSMPNKTQTASAARGSNWKEIGEIYNGDGTFSITNLNELYKAIAGEASFATVQNVAGSPQASDSFRSRNGGNNVSVMFNGLKWDAVYLMTAQDNGGTAKTGDIILDLWQSADTVNQTSQYQTFRSNHTTKTYNVYPSNEYSTSVVRNQALNAGGTYATGETSAKSASQSSSNTYARFTMSGVERSVVAYIVKPADVAYQKTENARELGIDVSYTLNNDAWGSPSGSVKFNGSGNNEVNYANGASKQQQFYADWNNDYIWLPSVTETGRNDKGGLWATDTSLKSSMTGDTWLRSASFYNEGANSYVLDNNGNSNDRKAITSSCSVRPALHLNLTKINDNVKVGVTNSVTHLTFQGASEARPSANYTAKLTAVTGYQLPSSITVTVGGSTLATSQYSYNPSTGDISIPGSSITGDIKITANGVAKQINVTFDKQNGSGGNDNVTATYDSDMPSILVPTRTGYTFQGYYDASGSSGTQYYNATGGGQKNCDKPNDFTLYAHWSANHYTVKYDGNKPSNASNSVAGSTTKSSHTYDTPSQLTKNNFTLTGWTFQGWSTKSGDGQTVDYHNQDNVSTLVAENNGSITLYAVWKQNTYTIEFNQNKPTKASGTVQGNMANEPRTYDDAEKPLTENTFTLTGWTFQGWATNSGDGQAVVHGDMASVRNLTADSDGTFRLYAVWKQNTYTITLNPMGGTNASETTATYDDPLPDITVPDRYGYEFLGYFDHETDGEKYYEAGGGKTLSKYNQVADDITLYAHWEAITYKIRFYNDGKFIKETNLVVFGTLNLPTAEELGLSRENFDFAGWNLYDKQNWAMYEGGSSYAVGLTGTQDDIVTLYAAWLEKPVHTLFYDANGGSGAPAAEQLHEGEGTTIQGGPERDDYTFAGWGFSATSTVEQVKYHESDPFTMGTEGVTLYAVWKHNPSLKYDANGGEWNYNIETYPAAGSKVKLTEEKPTRVGYTFAGWTVDKDAGSPVYGAGETFTMLEEDTTLHAVWKIGEYKITKEVANGYSLSETFERMYKYQEVASFTVTGTSPKVYINGVLTSAGEGGQYTFTVLGDTTILVADGNSLSLVYSANGGENAPTDTGAYASGGNTNVSRVEPTRKGYTFQGWAEDKAAEEATYKAGEGGTVTFESKDVVLYAVWKANTYTVSYHDENGADGSMDSSSYSYGQTKALPINGFSRTGYNFVGWATSSGGEVVFEDQAEVLNLTDQDGGKIELYACWEKMKTLIEFDACSGAGGSASLSVEYGNALPTSGVMAPTRNGYTFGGYFTAAEGQEEQIFGADMQPVGDMAAEWKMTAQELTLYAYWIPTTETLEKSVDEVQERLEGARQALQASIDDNQQQLSSQLSDLSEAYVEADKVLKQALLSADEGLKAELMGKINGLQTQLNAAKETLNDAIDALDKRLSADIESLRDAISRDETNISELQTKLSKLSGDYQAADTLIRSEFAAADSALQNNINNLGQRLTDAQSALQDSIDKLEAKLDDEVSKLEKSISDNRGEIEDELKNLQTTYEAADELIRSDIAALQTKDSELTQSISDLKDTLDATDKRLQAAIDQLRQDLNDKAEALQKAINDNEDDIEAKVAAMDAAYKNADATLRSEMNDINTALGKRIDDAINDLTTAMNNADNKLQDAIDKVQQNLNDAVADLQSSLRQNRTEIEDELSAMSDAYKAADAIINSDIADLQDRDNTLAKNLAVLDYSYKAADRALQVAIGQVRDNLDSAVADLQAAIEANETDIEDKVSALDGAYQAADTLLRSDMAAADEAIENSVAALETAMNDADSALQTAIDTVQDNLDSAVADLQAAIEANETDIEDKVSALDGAYKAADTLLRSDMTAADEALETAMNDADAALQSAIEKVQTNLDKAVKNLQASIDANETDIENKVQKLDAAYRAADTLLRSDMTAADEELDAKIAALEKSTNAADSALQKAIDKVQTDLDKAVAELQAAISANGTDLEDKVSALDSAYKAADALIDSGIAGLKAQDSALAESISALDTAYKAADEALWAGIRKVEGKHDALKEESEQMAMIYMIVNIALGAVAAGLIATLVVKTVRKKNSQE